MLHVFLEEFPDAVYHIDFVAEISVPCSAETLAKVEAAETTVGLFVSEANDIETPCIVTADGNGGLKTNVELETAQTLAECEDTELVLLGF